MLPEAVFTVNRKRPSWLISTQHGAVCRSANGEAPIEASAPSSPTLKADTVPLPAPSWALETNSCLGSVGRNSLPKGPAPWAGKGEPGAATSRPFEVTLKLSIFELLTRVPTRLVPLELKSTSPGCASSGSGTREADRGVRWPPEFRANHV